jgi:hypothetical protein
MTYLTGKRAWQVDEEVRQKLTFAHTKHRGRTKVNLQGLERHLSMCTVGPGRAVELRQGQGYRDRDRDRGAQVSSSALLACSYLTYHQAPS